MARPLLLLAAVALLSCRQAPVQEPDAHRANLRARLIWKVHEDAVARAINGEVRDDEFGRACVFFQEVTGIEVHGDGEYAGWMATKETGPDLPLLRAWYQRNAARLRADERGHVTVANDRRLDATRTSD